MTNPTKIMTIEELYLKPITVSSPEDNKVIVPHSDPLIILVRMNKFLMKRILINTECFMNLVTFNVCEKLGLEKKNLSKVSYPLVGLGDKLIPILGTTNLTIVTEMMSSDKSCI